MFIWLRFTLPQFASYLSSFQTDPSEALVNEMKGILTTVAADNEIVIEHMEVMPDHVHVLISFPPSKAPTSAIKALKGRSAFIFLKRHPEIRQSQYWGGHLWSPSYYMSTLGNMSKEVVEQYINNQKYNEIKKRPKGRK